MKTGGLSEFPGGVSSDVPPTVLLESAQRQLDALRETVDLRLTALRTLLAEKPDLSAVDGLPMIPLATGGQAFIAQAEYLETETLTGVRYLTTIRQDVGPTLDGQVRYLFEGLTKDGQYVVSVQYFVLTGVLPTEIPVGVGGVHLKPFPHSIVPFDNRLSVGILPIGRSIRAARRDACITIRDDFPDRHVGGS